RLRRPRGLHVRERHGERSRRGTKRQDPCLHSPPTCGKSTAKKGAEEAAWWKDEEEAAAVCSSEAAGASKSDCPTPELCAPSRTCTGRRPGRSAAAARRRSFLRRPPPP